MGILGHGRRDMASKTETIVFYMYTDRLEGTETVVEDAGGCIDGSRSLCHSSTKRNGIGKVTCDLMQLIG